MFKLPPYFFYRLWHLTILENLRDWKWSLARDWKSLKFSIRHLRLYTMCPECAGAGEYYNSYDIRDCSSCKDKSGFVPVKWYHVEDFFHWYPIKIWLKGCKPDSLNMIGVCDRGSWGCLKHRKGK